VAKVVDSVLVIPSWSDTYSFPGGDTLGLSKYPRDPQKSDELLGSLDNMDGYFIESGPYHFKLSTKIEDHLTLNLQREILLYWEGLDEDGDPLSGVPGARFEIYRWHTLGRYPMVHGSSDV
jgi:hypothetical protein